jgi:hypothetical protein
MPYLKPTSPEQVVALRDRPIECAAAWLANAPREERRKVERQARAQRISTLEFLTGYAEPKS